MQGNEQSTTLLDDVGGKKKEKIKEYDVMIDELLDNRQYPRKVLLGIITDCLTARNFIARCIGEEERSFPNIEHFSDA